MSGEPADRAAAIEAIEAIATAKARYFRGVDMGDADLVRSILAEDCVLDYMGCCTDPVSGVDHMPALNMVMRGRAAWPSAGLRATGIVSQHQGFNPDIGFSDADRADVVWAMTDRLWMPPGAPFACLTGYGFYHESYVRTEGAWLLRTLRIERIRVEVA